MFQRCLSGVISGVTRVYVLRFTCFTLFTLFLFTASAVIIESGRLERCYLLLHAVLLLLRFYCFTLLLFYLFYANQLEVPRVAAGPE